MDGNCKSQVGKMQWWVAMLCFVVVVLILVDVFLGHWMSWLTELDFGLESVFFGRA